MAAPGRSAGRVRRNPWLAVAIAAGAVLVAAWLAWAVHVASDKSLNEGLGVLIAWPALIVAAALILVPLVAIYLLIRPREVEPSAGEESAATEPEAHAGETGWR